MPRFFTTYWKSNGWRGNTEGERCDLSGSNLYKRRRIQAGDVVYVVSNCKGIIHLGGRMTVKEIVSRRTAIRKKRNPNLYPAKWWSIGSPATRLRLGRSLDRRVARQLNFVVAGGRQMKGLVFDGSGGINPQTLRGVRQLDESSARFLDEILSVTDRNPQKEIVLPPALLRRYGVRATG